MAVEAAENGRNMRIKRGDGASPETFTSIAGAREDSFSTEVGEIDITDKDSAGYKTLLEGGIKSASLSVSGIARDRASLFDGLGKIENHKLEWEDGDAIIGAFQMGSLEITGTNENGSVTFSAEFRSSGAFTFTPAV